MSLPLRFVNNTGQNSEQNLCFVNAPTQAFLSLDLTRKFFSGKSSADLAKKPISSEIKRLLCANPRSCVSLKELRRLVGISQGKHYTGSQEDSHEFFTFLLNSLRKEGAEYLFGEFSNILEITTSIFSSPNNKCPAGHFYSPRSFQNEFSFINLDLDEHADSLWPLSLQHLIVAKYSNAELPYAKCNECCQCEKIKMGVVIKVFVFLGVLQKLLSFFLCPVLLW